MSQTHRPLRTLTWAMTVGVASLLSLGVAGTTQPIEITLSGSPPQGQQSGEISTPVDEDWYYFDVPSGSGGTWSMWTQVGVNTVLSLHTSYLGALLAENDDCTVPGCALDHSLRHSRIDYGLTAGMRYYLKVRGFGIGTGTYTVKVRGPEGGAPEPLVADAGDDQTVEQESATGTQVTLDGSGTSGGVPPLTYEWYEGATLLGTGETLAVSLPLGDHDITLVVTDAAGNSDSDECKVTVVDTTDPSFSLNVLKDRLWPPNHGMHLCATVTDVGDICDVDPTIAIVVTSNEEINGPGDGNTEPDWEVIRNGDVWEIWLRAERDGASSGREYTIDVSVTDAAGNSAAASATVTVPRDQGKGKSK